jgi:hypothetical protein
MPKLSEGLALHTEHAGSGDTGGVLQLAALQVNVEKRDPGDLPGCRCHSDHLRAACLVSSDWRAPLWSVYLLITHWPRCVLAL